MERVIKYRGQRIDTKEWVYGYYVRYEHIGTVRHIIVTDWAQVYANSFDVISETVSQFTGLLDKKSKEIYESDLIEVKNNKMHFISEIEWNETAGCFEFQDTKNSWCGLDAIHVFKNGQSLYGGFVEIISNIHDNPELLEMR